MSSTWNSQTPVHGQSSPVSIILYQSPLIRSTGIWHIFSPFALLVLWILHCDCFLYFSRMFSSSLKLFAVSFIVLYCFELVIEPVCAFWQPLKQWLCMRIRCYVGQCNHTVFLFIFTTVTVYVTSGHFPRLKRISFYITVTAGTLRRPLFTDVKFPRVMIIPKKVDDRFWFICEIDRVRQRRSFTWQVIIVKPAW